MSESVVLCEGYYDRAFWQGWLTHLGCTDPGAPLAGQTKRSVVYDPWKDPVIGGQFAYHSKQSQSVPSRFVRVTPCQGKGNVLQAARIRLQQRTTKALLRLVINVDSDLSTATPAVTTSILKQQDVFSQVAKLDPKALTNADGDIAVDGGATLVSLIRWEATDPPMPGLPNEQTLERLVCAAIIAAHPNRAQAVQNWLDARPLATAPGPKEYAWSYMAGWYAEQGCDTFYSHIWNDPKVAAELEVRLRSPGAWRIAEALAV